MDHTEDAATTTVSLERLVKLERDNALMLSFILDDKRLEFNLPPGTSMDDVNYGAVNVQDVIERLRRNERVDLSGGAHGVRGDETSRRGRRNARNERVRAEAAGTEQRDFQRIVDGEKFD